ncbi:ShlB/FhaC/HecB family hemolysin secretion/activation protein, partial [Allocoleopsis sp.]|uniref:ShlB/FhaC/HecB family hemolysin secretion/activation protein n=1 Tax=Allocoleopsis sp. TaxID=3088169 RepID=UPI002FD1954D
MNSWKQILLSTGLLYLSCTSATLAQLTPESSNQVTILTSNLSAPPSPQRENREEPLIQEEEDNTKLRSNMVVETDAGTWGRGDTEKMNALRITPPENRQRITPQNTQQLAQTPPNLPPGIIEPTRPSLPPLVPTSPESPTPTSPLTPPPETPMTPPPQLGVKVKVKRVEVLGNTVFSPKEVEAVVASFVGKDATFEELLAIRTAITNLYTEKGYTTSGAFLPPQDLTDGVVKIQVVEGAIEKIEIEGLRRLRSSYVRSRINLATQTPVNLPRLEEALQLLQLNPLISTVQAELSAGTAPGLSVLKLKLKEAQPYTAALTVENRDSPSVGEIRGTVAIAHNNLLGFGDRFSFDYGISQGINTYNFGYDIPLNPRDGTLSVSYGSSSSRIVEQPFSDLDISADSYTLSVGFSQPLIRTPTREFTLGLSLDLRQSQTYLFENIPYSFSPGPDKGKSKLTVLRFSQDWTNRSASRVLAARSQFSFGLNALGATVNETSPDGRFISWLGQFQWVQALGGNTILIARAGAQLSLDSLLPIEQFSVGGIDTVRGYRQNQRVADNGIAGSLELHYPIIRKPDGIGTVQLAPFFDIGTAWNNQGEIPTPSTLASIGLGLRWQRDP